MDKYLDSIGTSTFFQRLLQWFPLVDRPRPATLVQHLRDYSLLQEFDRYAIYKHH